MKDCNEYLSGCDSEAIKLFKDKSLAHGIEYVTTLYIIYNSFMMFCNTDMGFVLYYATF